MIKFRKIILLLLIFSIFSINTGFALEDDIQTEEKEISFDTDIFLVGVPLLITSFLIDKPVKDFFQSNRTETLDDFFSAVENFGSPAIFGLGIGSYLYGYFTKNEKLATTSQMAIESSVIAAAIVFPVKYIVGRKRPEDTDKVLDFGFHDFDASFPSGHTALSFAFFGTFAKQYNDGIKPYIFYTIPTLVGISRIYKNKHWLSDVVGGAIVGLTSVYLGEVFHDKIFVHFQIGFGINISKKEIQPLLTYKF